MATGFYKIPRSLKKHPLWISASWEWRRVLDWLLENAAFTDHSFDVNHTTILLKKGQVAFTYRQIAKDCEVSKNHVEGAIKHFSGCDWRGDPIQSVKDPLLKKEENHKLRQKLRQEKSVYSILCEGYCKITQTTLRQELRQEQRQGSPRENQKNKDTNSDKNSDIRIGDKCKDVKIGEEGVKEGITSAQARAKPATQNKSPVFTKKQILPPMPDDPDSIGNEIFQRYRMMEEVLNDQRTLDFRLMNGKAVEQKTLHRWILETGYDFFKVIEWYQYRCQKVVESKSGRILGESYIEDGIKNIHYQTFFRRKYARDEDLKQKERHAGNQ